MGFLDWLFGKRHSSVERDSTGAGGPCIHTSPLRVVKTRGPQELGELCDKGLQAARIGDLRIAVAEWTLAASAEPDNAQTHLLLAAAFHVLRNLEKSAGEYRETIRLDPCCVEAHLGLAELLSRDALDRMKDTGERFTLGEALRRLGYYEDVLTSLATFKRLIEKATENAVADDKLVALTWRTGLQRFLEGEMDHAMRMVKVAGGPSYRAPCEWLRSMKFGPHEIIKVTAEGLRDQLSEYIDKKTMLYVLDPVMVPRPEIVKALKERHLPHIQITSSMRDHEIREALGHLVPGEILLASIQRVALGREFPWVYAGSWDRFVFVIIHPQLTVLPEVLGAFARTSTSDLQSVERIHIFAELIY